MRLHAGFLLTELIIGLAIAASLSLLLIDTLYRANKSRIYTEETVYVSSQAALLHHQLERDITTAFAPYLFWIPAEKTAASEAPSFSPNTKSDNQEKTPNTSPESHKKEPLKKLFYSVNTGDNLDTLTFITTSPLTIYWGEKTGSAKARVARVIYRFTKDADRPDTYVLTRQEGQDLDFDAYKPDQKNSARTYTIAKDIKKLTITYEVGVEKESTEQTTASPKETKNNQKSISSKSKNREHKPEHEQKPEIVYHTFTEWNQEQSTTNSDKTPEADIQKTPLPRLPHTVTIELVLWDHEHKRETPFTFMYTIAWRDMPKKPAPKKSSTPSPSSLTSSSLTSSSLSSPTPAYTTQLKPAFSQNTQKREAPPQTTARSRTPVSTHTLHTKHQPHRITTHNTHA